MAKTANIMTRIDPQIKEEAEMVLEQLGLSMSSAMEIYLRQIVLQRKIPFEMKLPARKPVSLGAISEEKFNDLMSKSITSYEEGNCKPAEKTFADIRKVMKYD